MARSMEENNTGIYRTVVTTTFLEDYAVKWYRTYKAGDVVTEVFGPHVTSSQNRNYSQFQTYRLASDGYFPDDYVIDHLRGKPRTKHVDIITRKVEYQKLKPVLALNTSGSLELELDWITYYAR